jgi:hypothetical protein
MYTTAMTLTEIYTKYQIPPNLVRHQLQVTAVGDYVSSHWNGPKIDKKLVTEALLLHDMGNIIKFKRPFLGELEKDAAHWEQVQEEVIQKYGSDVMIATDEIIKELGFEPIRVALDEMKDVWENPEREVSLEARICEYADCCVTPKGIEGFEIRMGDLRVRYHQDEHDPVIHYMRANADLLAPFVEADLSKLSAVDFSKEIERLSTYTF